MAWPIVIATNGIGIPVTEVPDGPRGGVPYEIATNGLGTPVVFVASGGMSVTRVGGFIPPDVPYPVYPQTTVADLSRKSLINGGPGMSSLTDVTIDGRMSVQAVAPTSEIVLAPATAGAAIDMSAGGSIVLYFKPESTVNTLSAGRCVLELGSDASVTSANFVRVAQFQTGSDFVARCTGANPNATPARPGPGRWQEYSVALSQFTETAGTGATLSAIRWARLRLRAGSGTATLDVEKIVYRPNPRGKAACVLFFDDADISQYTYVFPAMQALGFVGMLYPSPYQSVLGSAGKMTKANALEMQAAGWQVASQAWDSEDATVVDPAGPAALEVSFDAIRTAQRADGFYQGYDGSYFANVNFQDMVVNSAFLSKFRTARSFYLGAGPMPTPPALHGETWPIGDRFNIRAFSGASGGFGTTMGASLQALADQTIASKGLMMVGYHEELGSAGNARTGFDSLLAYLDANRANIEVMTLKQLLG